MRLTLSDSGQILQEAQLPTRDVSLRPSSTWTVIAHNDFFEWFISDSSPQNLVKNARFVLRNLISRGYSPGAKSVTGKGKGWLRAGLGGNNGFHFYLWFAVHGGEIGTEIGLKPGEVAVRIVRHHDETSDALNPQARSEYDNFLPNDIEGKIEDSVYTEAQVKAAITSPCSIQILKGYPGSGKTSALWLSGTHTENQTVMYITYSKRLATTADDYFRSFRPESSDIFVMTFPELVNEFGDFSKDAYVNTNPSDGAKMLEDILPRRADQLGKWYDRFDELYAELHAYAAGRSLPIDANNLPATNTPLLDADKYFALRRDAVGVAAAGDIKKILQKLEKEKHIKKLFPGPYLSREALEDINEPPLDRYLNVRTVLVDEVQDLTPMEALFLFNVVARIGCSSGQMPRLVLAGDESQTDRPTAFSWAELKNLATAVFGKEVSIEDTQLEQNLRSPRQIAGFVEATRQQYALLNKDERPSGLIQTQVDEERSGRLVYCSLQSDAEFNDLIETFENLPHSCIVYPGFNLPEDIDKSEKSNDVLYTAEQVKGLDFEHVVLVDAGRRQQDLLQLNVERTKDPSLTGTFRTMADQYRVASSRASENLILIDRDGQDRFEDIYNFCQGRIDLELEQLTYEDLPTLFVDDDDPENTIRALISDTYQLLETQTQRAIRKSRTIQKNLNRYALSMTPSKEIVDEVHRVQGVAALVGLLDPEEYPSLKNDELRDAAKLHFREIKLESLFNSINDLAGLDSSWASPRTLKVLNTSIANLEKISRDIPEVRRGQIRIILKWLDDLAEKDVPTEEETTRKVVLQAQEMVSALSSEAQYLVAQFDKTRTAWAKQCLTRRKPELALEIAIGMTTRDVPLEAECYVANGNFSSASQCYETLGDMEKAIEFARQIPDVDRALNLAESSRSESLATLQWLKSAQNLFESRKDENAGKLTTAEAKSLDEWVKQAKK